MANWHEDFEDVNVSLETQEATDREEADFDEINAELDELDAEEESEEESEEAGEYDGQPDDYTELSDFEQADEYFTGWAYESDPYE